MNVIYMLDQRDHIIITTNFNYLILSVSEIRLKCGDKTAHHIS